MDAFISQVSALAQRMGIKSLVIGVRDPRTNEVKVVTTAGAVEDLKNAVGAKFGLTDPAHAETEVGWGGA